MIRPPRRAWASAWGMSRRARTVQQGQQDAGTRGIGHGPPQPIHHIHTRSNSQHVVTIQQTLTIRPSRLELAAGLLGGQAASSARDACARSVVMDSRRAWSAAIRRSTSVRRSSSRSPTRWQGATSASRIWRTCRISARSVRPCRDDRLAAGRSWVGGPPGADEHSDGHQCETDPTPRLSWRGANIRSCRRQRAALSLSKGAVARRIAPTSARTLSLSSRPDRYCPAGAILRVARGFCEYVRVAHAQESEKMRET